MAVASKKKKIFDGRYEVLSIVGRGACSVVYHARQASNPASEVALKVLVNQKGGSSSTDRLRKEALAMVSSRHKYVVRLDDFHSVQDLCYLSMEYAHEGDLRKYSKKLGGRIPVEQALTFFRQAAEALNFVHRVGITHRDIKPDNILVLNERETRLTDFGVAVLPGERASLDELQQGVGTMSYMAPEVLEGKNCDKLSDIYSLGISFYEILSGHHPFDDVPLIRQLEARQDKNLKPISDLVPEIPDYFARIIMRCMRYEPDKRFISMNDLLKELNQDSEGKTASVDKTPPKRTKREKRRTPRIATKVSSKPKKVIPAKAETPKPAPLPPPESEDPYDDDFDKEIENILNELEAEDRLEEEKESSTRDEQASKDLAVLNPGQQAEEDYAQLDGDPAEQDYENITTEDTEVADDYEVTDDYVEKPSYLSDPRANAGTRRHSDYEYEDKPKQSWLSIILMLALAVYAGNYLMYKIAGISIFGSSDSERILVSDDTSATIIPIVTDPVESFPELPAGIYSGVIYDVIPGEESALTAISIPEQNALIFIVGIEGWTPTLSAIPEAKAGQTTNKIRVTSNGIVLDMQGTVIDGQVEGEYANAISGAIGKWRLKPL